MKQVSEFIESGVLELYVLGIASAEEKADVLRMAEIHSEIREEIEQISKGIEEYALAQAVQPKPAVKPMLLATIDYMERLKNGELFVQAPVLSPASRKEDFAAWLDSPEMQEPIEYDDLHVKMISANSKATTAIIWLRDMTDYEIHRDEYEHFLILEGACDFIVGEEVHSLFPGDYLAIPLHIPHIAKVTSKEPCKAIVQRIAA
jgi:mannose-6-phosphate isomerase-like protein (cupin superfamily)